MRVCPMLVREARGPFDPLVRHDFYSPQIGLTHFLLADYDRLERASLLCLLPPFSSFSPFSPLLPQSPPLPPRLCSFQFRTSCV